MDPLKNFLTETANTVVKTASEIALAKNTPRRAAETGNVPIPQSPVQATEVDPLTTENNKPVKAMLQAAPYLIYGGIAVVGIIIVWRLIKK